MNPPASDAISADRPADRLLLWSCLWGGGISWLLHLLAVWVFAEFGCLSELGVQGPLGISWVAWLVLAVTGLALCLALLAVWGSWQCLRRARRSPAAGGPDLGRFVGRFGLAANPLFLLVILAQTMPVFFHLKDCGRYIG